MRKIIVIVPTYNEAKNISILIEKIFSLKIGLSLLVVDDNSPDGTSEEVKGLQERYPRLYLLTRKRKLGLGSAYIEGFKFALMENFDLVVQMDADLSHSPGDIPEMIELLKKYDLVIGSRYVRKGGTSNWPLYRILLSKLANIFVKTLLRLPVNDLTSGLKCAKTEVLKNIDFITIASSGYFFQIEMVYRVFMKKFKIIEHPIIFHGRQNEKSKMSLGIVAEAFFKVIGLCLKNLGKDMSQ